MYVLQLIPKDANGFKPLHIPPKTSARNCQVGITTTKLLSEPSGKITGVSCLTSQNAQNKIKISYTLAIQHHTGFHRRPAEITWNYHILWSYTMIIYYDHMWVWFLYLTIMPGNIVRILPPSATKFSISDLQCKNHKDAGDQGDDSRPCLGGNFHWGIPWRLGCHA